MGEGVSEAPRGVYLHVPFCFHKCHYCDFYSVVGHDDRQPAFAGRMEREIAASAGWMREPVETIFAGGGTPTLLAPPLWRRIGDALERWIPRRPDAEFTVEANPETVTADLIGTLAAIGVNRLSIGAQSFRPDHLHTLERHHEPAHVARTIRLARDGGIDDVNLDLIFGIPGQTVRDWRDDLERALALEPTHLSCYGLTYEPTTPLAARRRAGEIAPVPEEVEAAMYETACDRLAAAGFEQYEISNWARPGRRCRHNLLYWTNAGWWPLGPGAAGHLSGVRWKNAPRLTAYLESDPLPPIVGLERLDEDGRTGEALMLGLRLTEGIPAARLAGLLAGGSRGDERRAAIERHRGGGLLESAAGHLRLTRRGRLLADMVLADLV